MKLPSVISGLEVFLEFRANSLKIVQGAEEISLPLKRDTAGRLTHVCKESVVVGLQGFLRRKAWQNKLPALCAIDARGVSFRRISLPASHAEDLQKLLRFQIEKEFPLSPDELAWGWLRAGAANGASSASKQQDFVVAAVKKDILEDYSRLLGRAGLNPVFTLAALARAWPHSALASDFAALDIGEQQSELILFENGTPTGVRLLPWGGDNITREIQRELSVTHEEAEKLKLERDDGPGTNGEMGRSVQMAIAAAIGSLAGQLDTVCRGKTLYVTGRAARYSELPARLAEKLPGAQCERTGPTLNKTGSPAIAGLQAIAKLNRGEPPLVLRLKESRTPGAGGKAVRSPALSSTLAGAQEVLAAPRLRRLVILAGALAVLVLLFPMLEAALMKPIFSKKVATVRAQKGRLALIDRELNFLQYLKQNQPPYLDALAVLATATAPGTRLESISMNRRGDLALKGAMQNSTQVVEFRSKLIKSGFFSIVTVEEQTPSPDRQKVSVRISGALKPAAARALVSVDTLLSNAPPITASMSGPGGFEGGFPGGPGMMFPPGMSVPMPPPGAAARSGIIPGAPPGPRTRLSNSSPSIRVMENGAIVLPANKSEGTNNGTTNTSEATKE